MSSNIRVQRICEFCGKEFEARKTTTKTCSDFCAKRNYKAKKKAEKIEVSNIETRTIKRKPVTDLKAMEFLTVRNVAKLLNLSTRTTYRMIEEGKIKAVKLSERKTIVKRSEIDNLFA